MLDTTAILQSFTLLVRKLRLAQLRERDLLERVLDGKLNEVKELRRIANADAITKALEKQVDDQIQVIARQLADVTPPAPPADGLTAQTVIIREEDLIK